MKKEKKQKKFKEVKEFLSDRRNKAIVKLGIYLVFFVIVIIYIRVIGSRPLPSSNNNNEEELPLTITEGVKQFKEISAYEYTFEYNYNNDIFKVDGRKYNDKWLFTFDGNEYYYDDSLYLLTGNGKEEIDETNIEYLLMLDIKKIYNYLLNSEYISRTENVNDELIITSNIILSDTVNEIKTINKDNVLESINIDLTNYYKIKDEKTFNFSVLIKYNNLNNIEDFSY